MVGYAVQGVPLFDKSSMAVSIAGSQELILRSLDANKLLR